MYSWKFQLQKTRTHYQDQLRLTSHVYPIVRKNAEEEGKKNKRGKPVVESSGMTNLLLIINNWNFVRDTQLQAMVKKCTPADFQVQLKLTSTAFRNASNPDCEFPFDKQAANFPYESFLQLYQSSGLKRFIRELRETYEDVEGSEISLTPAQPSGRGRVRRATRGEVEGAPPPQLGPPPSGEQGTGGGEGGGVGGWMPTLPPL